MDFRIHKPRDSILSWGSEFSNYEGLVNWGFLLLILGGLRLTLENFNKYGIRVNPSAWLLALFGNLDPSSNHEEYPTMFLIMCKYSFFFNSFKRNWYLFIYFYGANLILFTQLLIFENNRIFDEIF